MELAYVGLAILAIVVVVKVFQFIFNTVGKLLLPLILTVVTWITLHDRCQPQTTGFCMIVVFVITLLASIGKGK